MKTLFMGPQSPRNSIASIFLIFMLFSSSTLMAGPHLNLQNELTDHQTWTATHYLAPTTDSPPALKVDFQLRDPAYSLTVSYDPDQHALVLTLSFPTKHSLPAGTLIAQVQAGSGSFVEHLSLIAEGGAIAILLDEF